MKRKFIIFLTLILSFIFCFNVACTEEGANQSIVTPPIPISLPTINYEIIDGKTTSSEITSSEITSKECSLSLDFSGIIFDKEPTFNKNLAKMALLTIVQNDLRVDVNFITDTGKRIVGKSTYSEYGLQNEVVVSTSNADYNEDKNDLADAMLGNVLYEKGNKLYQLFFVTIIPYVGPSLSGWSSNFDVGADTDSYYSITGQHPDWINKKNHKGFDVSANRLYGKIADYVSYYKVGSASPVVFLTGHSRGGAIANLISKRMTDENIKNLAYCFNSPNTTTEPNTVTSRYSNIFNIINEDDIVSLVPPSGCNNFTRYGKTVTYKMSDHAQAWKEVFKETYKSVSSSNLKNLTDTLLFITTDKRENVYEFDKREDVIEKQTQTFESETDADDLIKKLSETFGKNDVFRKCIDISKTESVDSFCVTYSVRPCIILFIVQDLLSTGFDNPLQILSSALHYIDYLGAYISTTTIVSVISDLEGIVRAHLEITGLVGIDYIE